MLVTISLSVANGFSALAAPEIVVTTRPYHSLVSMVTEGITQPKLLLKAAQDPHFFHLKPSQSRMLHRADIIFLQSTAFEVFMRDMVLHLDDVTIFALADNIPQHYSETDHLWLHPALMLEAIQKIADSLARLDAQHGEAYRQNAARATQRLNEAMSEWQNIRESVAYDTGKLIITDKPSITLLMDFLHLAHPRSLTDSQHQTSWQAIRELEEDTLRCIFVTHGKSRIAKKAELMTGARLIYSHILGADFPPGPELYFQLIDQLVEQIYWCAER